MFRCKLAQQTSYVTSRLSESRSRPVVCRAHDDDLRYFRCTLLFRYFVIRESFSPTNEGITKHQNPYRLKATEICDEASYRQLFPTTHSCRRRWGSIEATE